MKSLAATLVVYLSCCLAAASHTGNHNSVLIDRKGRSMTVVDESGKTLLSCPIGIGRGPLRSKTDMSDCITPVGTFIVEVVLSNEPALNQIDQNRKLLISKNDRFAPFVKDGMGLANVFRTMNAQDFNRDGKPDRAYGLAFFGLRGKTTGPKLIAAGPSARWYSIALHGTPNEKEAIGGATSEGCIHVPKSDLRKILREHLIAVGTPVYIKDGSKDIGDVKRKSFADDNKELVRMRN